MSIDIQIDLDPILSRLDLIVETREADLTEVNERMEAIEAIMQVQTELLENKSALLEATSNMLEQSTLINQLMSFWNIGIMAFGIALLIVIIFALGWRK